MKQPKIKVSETWEKFFELKQLTSFDFDDSPFYFNVKDLHEAASYYSSRKSKDNEARILCKQDRREDRPHILAKNNLFVLPVENGKYCLLKGDGYLTLPSHPDEYEIYKPKIDFELKSLSIGNSEMQHLDYAYVASMVRTFSNDHELLPTIRGRKRSPQLSFRAGDARHQISVSGVQIEVDAGYEGREQIVLIEAKNNKGTNIINRQIFYPASQWLKHCGKPVKSYFFQKTGINYMFWEINITDPDDYHSLEVTRMITYRIDEN